ncbi:Ig-like domain-containing protein [Spirillospora sp. NPDC050679]
MKIRLTLAASAVAVASLAGCSFSGNGDKAGATARQESGPKVTVTPGDGTQQVRPDQRVSVSVGNGTLTSVEVRGADREVSGAFTNDRATWRASAGLKPSTDYTVEAIAVGKGGRQTKVTTAFTTVGATGNLRIADITPQGANAEKVGVGFPIIVDFNRNVTDKAAVERALKVRSDKPSEGSWYWTSPKQAVYRTKRYWAPHQKVRFTARLTGVAAGKGVYGSRDYARTFAVGPSHIATVDSRRHIMKVRIDGVVKRTMKISTGSSERPNFITASGPHLVMGKKRVEHMDSRWMGVDPKDTANGGYSEDIPWAVRITSSGEYVHQGAASAQRFLGVANMSHGCVRATPQDAQWFFGIAQRGDVVDVTGTTRPLPWTNGWSYWVKSWDQWQRGSALR